MRSATDLELPVIAVRLVSRSGYFKQKIDTNGFQIEQPDPWNPASYATQLNARVAITIEGRTVLISAWLYEMVGRREINMLL